MSQSPGPLSAFLTSLPLSFVPALAHARALGFGHVDVVAQIDRPLEHCEGLADSGLLVHCAALGRDLPPGHTLDAIDVETRRRAVRLVQQQLADAARLGALCAYLVPGSDGSPAARAAFADSCALLADHAAACQVRLAVEHSPGRFLASAASTLAWLGEIDHANLGLLLDVGHCLLSREDPADVIAQAGSRLTYVHLDDNDGAADLHWPLLTGQLTEAQLHAVAAALEAIGYGSGLALELNPQSADPVGALQEGNRVAQRCFALS
jgi:sugar phosphate isomerase/epimerase